MSPRYLHIECLEGKIRVDIMYKGLGRADLPDLSWCRRAYQWDFSAVTGSLSGGLEGAGKNAKYTWAECMECIPGAISSLYHSMLATASFSMCQAVFCCLVVLSLELARCRYRSRTRAMPGTCHYAAPCDH
jgi:hypothetical protein